ncbi:hypothetical protein, conserved in T. vivax [Trypanosoma vivax Y486]|uniref:Uncharacterized protein n=1 Tax=Trypanosoma vivax (strain Y486) TaxID=1055687 RepID=F9WSK0_TRYVY|nr:hypothetical protein, conserved in T. vivax [Trypanosoma vivax Y486]|eukprot:CCD20539.1 hypothetical protein, conserved in T. vivax [Trypanosoma vivax Y486]
MQRQGHNSHGLREGKVGKQRSRKGTGGRFSGIQQPVDNKQRHKRQRRRQRRNMPTGQSGSQWSRRLHRRQDHIRRHVHRKNKQRPRTAFQGRTGDRLRRRPGLDYKAHAAQHSRRHRTPAEEVPLRAKHRHHRAHHRHNWTRKGRSSHLRRAPSTRGSTQRTKKHTEGTGEGRTTRNSIAIGQGKKSRGRKQPGAQRDEGKTNRRGAPQRRHECSTCLARLARSVLSSSDGNAHIAHSGHKKQRTRGTKM